MTIKAAVLTCAALLCAAGPALAAEADLAAAYSVAQGLFSPGEGEDIPAAISTEAARLGLLEARARGLDHRANLLRQRAIVYKPGLDPELREDALRTISELAALNGAAEPLAGRIAELEAAVEAGDLKAAWAAEGLWNRAFDFESKAYMIQGQALLAVDPFGRIGLAEEGRLLDERASDLLRAAHRIAYRARALADKARQTQAGEAGR